MILQMSPISSLFYPFSQFLSTPCYLLRMLSSWLIITTYFNWFCLKNHYFFFPSKITYAVYPEIMDRIHVLLWFSPRHCTSSAGEIEYKDKDTD